MQELVDLRELVSCAPRLAQVIQMETFRKGEHILKQDAPFDRILLLVKGTAEAWQRPTSKQGIGEPQLVNRLMAGDVMGEIAVVMKSRRISEVIASDDLTALSLLPQDLNTLFSISPSLTNALVRWFAQDVSMKSFRTALIAEGYPVGAVPLTHTVPTEPFVSNESTLTARTYLDHVDHSEIAHIFSQLACVHVPPEKLTPQGMSLFRLFQIPARECLLKQGEMGETLLVQCDGWSGVMDQDNQVVGTFVAGNKRPVNVLLGEQCFLIPGKRNASIFTGADSRLLELSRAQVPELVRFAPLLSIVLHLAILQATCQKLTAISARSASRSALEQGDLGPWFEEDDAIRERFER